MNIPVPQALRAKAVATPVSALLGDQESFRRRQRDISARLLRRAPADDVASHPTLSHERNGCVIARIEMIGKDSSQVRPLGQYTQGILPRTSHIAGHLVWVNRIVAPEPLTADSLHVGRDVANSRLLSRPLVSASQGLDVRAQLCLSFQSASVTLCAGGSHFSGV
jgi:hypothetical protein